MCSPCMQLGDQAINILVNYIMNAGVIGGCGELCSQLPAGGGKQSACELVCGAVGLKTFISVLDNTDLDTFYACSALKACQPGPDDAAIDYVATHAKPNPVSKGDTVTMQLAVNVSKASGLGEFHLSVSGPVTNGGLSQGFMLYDGIPEGEQVLGVNLDIKDNFPDPTSGDFPTIWNPGTYNFSFHVCQAECGSAHPHSIDFGKLEGTFELQEADITV